MFTQQIPAGQTADGPDSLHPVTLTDVALGEPLQFDVFDDIGRLLLRAGFVVTSNAQLARLIERGLFATRRALDAARAAAAAATSDAELPTTAPAVVAATRLHLWQQLAAVDQALTVGLVAIGQEYAQGQNLGQGRNHSPIQPAHQPIITAAGEIRRLVELDSDLMLASLFLTQPGAARASHAMATGVVAQMLMGASGIDPAMAASCVSAAVCFDIVAAQSTIEAALRGCGVTDESWLEVVRRHQDKADPAAAAARAGQTDALDQYTAMLDAASSYCTLIRPRGFVEALTADQAIKSVVASGRTPLTQDAARKLLATVGVYPPGCAVVLANGEVGVVLRRTRHASGPVVKALRSPRGQDYEDGPKRLTSEPFFKIERIADLGKLGITVAPERWWSTVVASGAAGVQALART